MAKQTVPVPDIGGAENVDVIEVCVAPGDTVAAEDSLIVLESDKASMDVPAPFAGKVVAVLVKEGDQVSEGTLFIEIETDASDSSAPAASAEAAVAAPVQAASVAPQNAAEIPVKIPDIGGSEGVDVIELCVAVGDTVAEGDSLIVLESDKASMEVPSPAAGTVVSIVVAEGSKVSEGDDLLVLALAAPAPSAAPAQAAAPQAAAAASTSTMDVTVPDIGGSEGVDVIEVCVAEGDEVKEGDSIVVLESDKASMEVPAPASGKVLKLLIKEGDKASLGTPVLTLQVNGGAQVETSAAPAPVASSAPSAPAPAKRQTSSEAYSHVTQSVGSDVYAGPAVRKLARELGVELVGVKGTGPRGRMSKDDLKAHVKMLMQKKPTTAAVTGGSGIPAIPAVDFSKFGEVEIVKMSKIHKITAANMSRNWLNVPHVTQFDDADITDLEEFRKGMKAEAEKAGIKLTPLPFLLKACAAALKYEPTFNASMHADGEHIVKKKYINIGIAVATPNGLMVPVIKDVDKKGLYQLAQDSNALAKKARDGKLLPKEMQGGCFTISSLGPIGGTGFTPIVNAPEVAILGVSKAAIKPVWNGKEFVPRQLLPLCLSYDHRAINGADAGRFFTYLNAVISDVRKLIL